MKITKWILIVLIVLFVVGCNGNPTKTGSQTSNTNSVSPTNDVSKEFSDLAASKAKATYQETYDITSTVQGQPPRTVTQTLYVKDGKVRRADMSASGDEVRYYMNDNRYTLCSQSKGSWECYGISSVPQDQSDQNQKEVQTNPSKYNLASDGTMDVAGVITKCFKISEVSGSGVSMRFCYSQEGVGLYSLLDSPQMKIETKATKYSTSVSDSDLNTPVAVKTVTVPTYPCSTCQMMQGQDKTTCMAQCSG
ncbi:MAG TPA: hypothetical protein VJI52_00875 [Candidatus Nanoarchaeia archaeon]|nr:hypothetical protein [Candidatus Nanoarchaeia archaeon]